MKSLRDYILESYEEDLDMNKSTNYVFLSELLMFLDASDEMNERKQVICDVFRKNYHQNLQKEDMISSRVFQRFVDDLVKLYNEKNDEHFKLNVTTRKRLENELASKMIVKINTEQDQPLPNIEDPTELWK